MEAESRTEAERGTESETGTESVAFGNRDGTGTGDGIGHVNGSGSRRFGAGRGGRAVVRVLCFGPDAIVLRRGKRTAAVHIPIQKKNSIYLLALTAIYAFRHYNMD